MDFETAEKTNLLICDNCRGTGFVGLRKCNQCRGMCMGYIKGKKFFYWGEPLTRYHILLKKWRHRLNVFRIIGGLIFSFGFLFIFFYTLYDKKYFSLIFDERFWQSSAKSVFFFFFLSVIGFAYLIYRISEQKIAPTEVENFDYDDSVDNTEGDFLQTWEEVYKISNKNRIDISETFSNSSKQVLKESYKTADKFASSEVLPIHIFYALFSSVRVANIFIRLGIGAEMLQANLAELFRKNPNPKDKTIPPVLSDDMIQILFNSYNIAYRDHQDLVDVTELLLATVHQSQKIQELLYDLKIDGQKLENVIEWIRVKEKLRRQYIKLNKAGARRSKYGLDRAMTAVATPYLNSFSQDITMRAKYGLLSACVARESEIEEIFRIIEGGGNSVVLVGDRGVGKMSIIEAIAQKMVEEDVPSKLNDKRLVQLSVSALLAGTTTSGAQERLLKIMEEVSKAGNIILFIKNIHDLIGLDSGASEGLDVAETFSEYLGPGKFLTFATTTIDEYKRVLSGSELSSVLSKVDIKEMDKNQSIKVLESKVGELEYKNGVFFSYDSIDRSVEFAEKFITDKNLPESAILLISEVATFVKNKKGKNQLVTAEDVGIIIEQKTGIPAQNISEDESSKLMRLEEEMHKRIIGQDMAVTLVANALRRARTNIKSDKRPIANFLFLGPTGVGKTELAKTIASIYFGGEDRMIRVDMSEYQDRSSIYRMIGEKNQAGTGVLTEAVKDNPFSLILLDELEKADKNVLNLFLQVFDDGRLTDSTGNVIDFSNAIIIATSNAGTNFVQEKIQQNIPPEEIREELIKSELKNYFQPEFINRFDGVVLFQSLGKKEIKKIAGLMLDKISRGLSDRGLTLKYDEGALEALAKVGYDPEFGARPMRRAIQDNVENKLAELILQNKTKRRDVVEIDGNLNLRIRN